MYSLIHKTPFFSAIMIGVLTFMFVFAVPVPAHAVDVSSGHVGPAAKNEVTPAICTTPTWWWPNTLLTCVFRTILSSIGAGFVYLAMMVLVIAGGLFNVLIDQTIIQLGSTLFGSGALANGIVTGWTVFRDLANIAIIGMFVFIAINFILGNSNYGDKKLIARVLIVATLINFSFLFTKIVINISGVTAAQVYVSSSGGISGAMGPFPGDSWSQAAQAGPAGKLVQFMGVETIGDTANGLINIADNAQNGWVALAHGLLAATLLLATALTFLYGSFILLTRAVLFVFLLITASLAFATHLIPSISDGHFGWKAWWGALLRNAALAPLLMLFLWITMNIADSLTQSLAAKGMHGSLSGLADSPTSGTNLEILFDYLFILGLLFASFKISSALASATAGFGTAQKGIGSALAVPMGLAGAGVSYMAQRGAYAYNKRLDKKIAEETDGTKVARLIQQKQIVSGVAKATNVGSGGMMKLATGALGLKGAAAGQFKVDYAKTVKERGKKIEETYGEAALTSKRKENITKTAGAAVEKERGSTAAALKDKKDKADIAHKEAIANRDTAVAKRTEAQTKLSEQKNRQAEALADIQKRRNSLSTSGIVMSGGSVAAASAELDAKEAAVVAESKRLQDEHDAAARTATDAEAVATRAKAEHDAAEVAHKEELTGLAKAKSERAEKMMGDYSKTLRSAIGSSVINPLGRDISGLQNKDFVNAGMNNLDKLETKQKLKAQAEAHAAVEADHGISHGADHAPAAGDAAHAKPAH